MEMPTPAMIAMTDIATRSSTREKARLFERILQLVVMIEIFYILDPDKIKLKMHHEV